MLHGNRWVRRRARRLYKAFPYVSIRDAIISAMEDYRAMYPEAFKCIK